jgi:CO dehydrogenase/acetyl-CoA synthase beta subunit
VIDDGKLTSEVGELSVAVNPPVGAGCLRVRVAVAVFPKATGFGATVRLTNGSATSTLKFSGLVTVPSGNLTVTGYSPVAGTMDAETLAVI